MNNEEKILAILEQHSKMFEKMQEDISSLKAGQSSMQEDISSLKAGQSSMQEDISSLKAGQSSMQDDIAAIKTRLDYDVDVRFNAINASLDVIKKRLDTLDDVKELAEETKEKVDVIHAVVAQHSQDIKELKKA